MVRNRNDSGVSLIEVSVLLIVIGALVGPAIYAYRLAQQELVISRTKGNLEYVRDSLVKYAIENGRYPIPAVRDLPVNDAGAGVEYTAAILPCGAGNNVPCHTTGAPPRIIIGDVPFRALGINAEHIIDGYRGKLSYAVTEDLTATATFSDAGGIIRIIKLDNLDEPLTSSNAHFALISHGRDNSGTFSFNGSAMAPCPAGAAANRDTINCDNTDVTFTTNSDFTLSGDFKRAQYLGAGPAYYDDYVYFVTNTQRDIWSYTIGSPDMQNRNVGNALIGQIPNGLTTGVGPRPDLAVAKMEVMGDVRTDILTANRLCHVDSTDGKIVNAATTCPDEVNNPALTLGPDTQYQINEFDPGIIAVGTTDPANYGLQSGGIRCRDKGLRGIANSDEECVNVLPSPVAATIVNCPIGSFPKGTDALGGLICIVPP
ncbi:MAG: hypothetical protein R3E13_08390 [Alphaproteobacteria bacterium]